MEKHEAVLSKDIENKKITVVKEFDATLVQTWKAWTTSEILDLWWAPKPYQAQTKTMDFNEDGHWLYCMAGPEGDKSWCRVDYITIESYKIVKSAAMFCDEEGNENLDFPRMNWKQDFSETAGGTTVTITIRFNETADMEMIVQLGFEEGFKAALENLDHYFETT